MYVGIARDLTRSANGKTAQPQRVLLVAQKARCSLRAWHQVSAGAYLMQILFLPRQQRNLLPVIVLHEPICAAKSGGRSPMDAHQSDI